MPLVVYNTASRKKEVFVPHAAPVVRIYTCGLTVYAPMHIGHARTYCFWDLFRRWLEYRGYTVLAVINYTDIDDRIMKNGDGVTRGAVDVAEENVAAFRRDCRMLAIREYAAYTRATDYTREQIEIIEKLLAKGHAYVQNGEVFYSVESFAEYGKLSGRSLDEQEVGASGRVGEDFARKRHPADFTLWKPSSDGQSRWETGHADWPQGRPGWHIECSAMSTALLGAQFDVHGGGIDNLFPHHENEVAQSAPLCGYPWVKYWLHPEHLDLRGVKMSKSLGNVIGVPDLVERYGADATRFFFSSGHYRTKLGFADELVLQCSEGFARIRQLHGVLRARLHKEDVGALETRAGLYATERPEAERFPRLRHKFLLGSFEPETRAFMERFTSAMDDDLDTPAAIAALFDYVRALNAKGIESSSDASGVLAVYRCLVQHLWVLGVEWPDARLFPEHAAECVPVGDTDEAIKPYAAILDKLVAARQTARKNKDFAKADMLRDLFAEAGIVVEDTPAGPRWKL